MVSRTVTALLGLLASLAVSVLVWQVFGVAFVFLFVPFVPFLLGRGRDTRRESRTCPECGFETRDPGIEYCPYDGTPLQHQD